MNCGKVAVSFVIPACNEDLLLSRTLDSIQATADALKLDYEVVVADDVRFTIVKAAIITSGRKLRAYRGREMFAALARLSLRGTRGAKRREGFEMGYGPRRSDPGS